MSGFNKFTKIVNSKAVSDGSRTVMDVAHRVVVVGLMGATALLTVNLGTGIYQLRQNAKQYEVEHPEEMAAHRARKKALKEGTAVENVETTTE